MVISRVLNCGVSIIKRYKMGTVNVIIKGDGLINV